MSYYTAPDGLEYTETGYEALEHRAFKWRDFIMRTKNHPPGRALKLAWRIVRHEETTRKNNE